MRMASSYHTDEECGRARSSNCRILRESDCGDDVDTTWSSEWWTLITCPHDDDDAHIDTVVIAVDGACRNNGKPSAEASYGVFFHRDNHQWNECAVLPDDFTTNQQAELAAGLNALRLAKRLRWLNTDECGRPRRQGPMRRLSRVLITSDSSYLVNAMTDWIYKWRQNGYLNSRDQPVTNAGLFQQLEAEVQELNDLDVEVQFWHVPRAENVMANMLASAALDGETASDRMRRYNSALNAIEQGDDYDSEEEYW